MSDSPSPLRNSNVLASPPQSPFQPVLPALPDLRLLPPSRSKFTPVPEFKPIEPVKREPIYVEATIAEETEPSSQEAPSGVKEEQNDDAPPAFQADEGFQSTSAPLTQEHLSVKQIFARILVWSMIAITAYSAWNYKVESASIGFCDRGSSTNQALDAIKTRRAAAVICNRERQSTVERPLVDNPSNLTQTCPLPPLLPLPVPSSCTPCPEHGSCTQCDVTCDSGYLLKPHLLLSFLPVVPSQTSLTSQFAPHLSEAFFKGLSAVFDGFFGSVALPPRCVEDPRRKKHIGNLGKAIEARLAKERGRRICRGDRTDPSEPEESPEQAAKWGVEIGKLKADFKKTANVSEISRLGGTLSDEDVRSPFYFPSSMRCSMRRFNSLRSGVVCSWAKCRSE